MNKYLLTNNVHHARKAFKERMIYLKVPQKYKGYKIQIIYLEG
jgi:hypothetical protein